VFDNRKARIRFDKLGYEAVLAFDQIRK